MATNCSGGLPAAPKLGEGGRPPMNRVSKLTTALIERR